MKIRNLVSALVLTSTVLSMPASAGFSDVMSDVGHGVASAAKGVAMLPVHAAVGTVNFAKNHPVIATCVVVTGAFVTCSIVAPEETAVIAEAGLKVVQPYAQAAYTFTRNLTTSIMDWPRWVSRYVETYNGCHEGNPPEWASNLCMKSAKFFGAY